MKGAGLGISVALHATVFGLLIHGGGEAAGAPPPSPIRVRVQRTALPQAPPAPVPQPVAEATAPQVAPPAKHAPTPKAVAQQTPQPPSAAAPSDNAAPSDDFVNLDTVLGGEGTGPGVALGNGGRGGPGVAKAPPTFAPAPKPEPVDCPEKPTKPEVVSQVEISYPASARAKGVEGQVILRAHIDISGAVSKVDVVRSVSSEIDVAAISALKGWRFRPALACGKPTSGTYTMTYRFELGT